MPNFGARVGYSSMLSLTMRMPRGRRLAPRLRSAPCGRPRTRSRPPPALPLRQRGRPRWSGSWTRASTTACSSAAAPAPWHPWWSPRGRLLLLGLEIGLLVGGVRALLQAPDAERDRDDRDADRRPQPRAALRRALFGWGAGVGGLAGEWRIGGRHRRARRAPYGPAAARSISETSPRSRRRRPRAASAGPSPLAPSPARPSRPCRRPRRRRGPPCPRRAARRAP